MSCTGRPAWATHTRGDATVAERIAQRSRSARWAKRRDGCACCLQALVAFIAWFAIGSALLGMSTTIGLLFFVVSFVGLLLAMHGF